MFFVFFELSTVLFTEALAADLRGCYINNVQLSLRDS